MISASVPDGGDYAGHDYKAFSAMNRLHLEKIELNIILISTYGTFFF